MKAAVITTPTIGDGLLMMIAASQLRSSGFEVCIYNSSMHELKDWFGAFSFKPLPKKNFLIEEFLPYDLIFAVYRKDPFISDLLSNRKHLNLVLASFSGSNFLNFSKEKDILFDTKLSMAKNISFAMSKILKKEPSKDNLLKPPKQLTYRKHIDRIILHPTSNTSAKNWNKMRFIQLAKKLTKKHFKPIFAVGPKEIFAWYFVKELGFDIVTFPSLHELACYIYESGYVIGNDSGLVHLSSNLEIPSITIASNQRKMRLWRADWLPTHLLCPSHLIPNIKGLRLRDRFWSYFISCNRVIKTLRRI